MALGHDGGMRNLGPPEPLSGYVPNRECRKAGVAGGGNTGRSTNRRTAGAGWAGLRVSSTVGPVDRDGLHTHISHRDIYISRVNRLAGWFPQFRSAVDRIPRRAMCVAHLVTCLGLAVGCERLARPLSPPVRSPWRPPPHSHMVSAPTTWSDRTGKRWSEADGVRVCRVYILW